jgi:hypothetical protein
LTFFAGVLLLLPTLFWNQGPQSANVLAQADIHEITVPPALADSWKSAGGFTVHTENPNQLTSLPAPGVTIRARQASATQAPWVVSNGWRFLRQPDGRFCYDAPGPAAALAAAEAFMYNAHAVIRTDEAGLPSLGRMLKFLRTLGANDLPPKVNIAFVDDGSAASGEFMNLLVRRNLLFKAVKSAGDDKTDLHVALGEPEYPKDEASNPALLAEKVRANLTDAKRLLRIYGSEVVIGRLVGTGDQTRLYLLNYAASKYPIDGVRVRILGDYSQPKLENYDDSQTGLLDIAKTGGAIEFTLPRLKEFAVVDLAR